MGGLSAANALEMLQAIGGIKALSSVQVFLFQEIVTDAGKFFSHNREWKLAFGKQEGEWRGEGVGFRRHAATHSNTQVMAGGVALVLCTSGGNGCQRTIHASPHSGNQQAQGHTSRAEAILAPKDGAAATPARLGKTIALRLCHPAPPPKDYVWTGGCKN